MNTLMCMVMLVFSRVDASDTPKPWGEWLFEGRALMALGKYSLAAQALRQALLDAEHSNAGTRTLLGVYGDLASAYADAGEYAESEREYRRALSIAEKTEGRQSMDYALLAANLAVLPTQYENREFFIVALREAIISNARTGSAQELGVLRGCLAQILMKGKRYAEAEAVLLDARPNFERLRRENAKLFAEMLTELGLLSFNQGHFEESIDRYRDSIRLFKEATAVENPFLITPLNDLALSYLKLGRLEEAEPALSRASILCGKTLGDDHPACGAILENYAVLLRKLGRKRDAKPIAARAREIKRASRRHNGMDSTVSITTLRSGRD